jgi:hypothetical protein
MLPSPSRLEIETVTTWRRSSQQVRVGLTRFLAVAHPDRNLDPSGRSDVEPSDLRIGIGRYGRKSSTHLLGRLEK